MGEKKVTKREKGKNDAREQSRQQQLQFNPKHQQKDGQASNSRSKWLIDGDGSKEMGEEGEEEGEEDGKREERGAGGGKGSRRREKGW